MKPVFDFYATLCTSPKVPDLQFITAQLHLHVNGYELYYRQALYWALVLIGLFLSSVMLFN
jgi:hypothetical protein